MTSNSDSFAQTDVMDVSKGHRTSRVAGQHWMLLISKSYILKFSMQLLRNFAADLLMTKLQY